MRHIVDSTDIAGHVRNANGLEFFLGKSIPLPDELGRSLEFIKNFPTGAAEKPRPDLLLKVEEIATESTQIQEQWGQMTHPGITENKPSLMKVAIIDILNKCNIG